MDDEAGNVDEKAKWLGRHAVGTWFVADRTADGFGQRAAAFMLLGASLAGFWVAGAFTASGPVSVETATQRALGGAGFTLLAMFAATALARAAGWGDLFGLAGLFGLAAEYPRADECEDGEDRARDSHAGAPGRKIYERVLWLRSAHDEADDGDDCQHGGCDVARDTLPSHNPRLPSLHRELAWLASERKAREAAR